MAGESIAFGPPQPRVRCTHMGRTWGESRTYPTKSWQENLLQCQLARAHVPSTSICLPTYVRARTPYAARLQTCMFAGTSTRRTCRTRRRPSVFSSRSMPHPSRARPTSRWGRLNSFADHGETACLCHLRACAPALTPAVALVWPGACGRCKKCGAVWPTGNKIQDNHRDVDGLGPHRQFDKWCVLLLPRLVRRSKRSTPSPA